MTATSPGTTRACWRSDRGWWEWSFTAALETWPTSERWVCPYTARVSHQGQTRGLAADRLQRPGRDRKRDGEARRHHHRRQGWGGVHPAGGPQHTDGEHEDHVRGGGGDGEGDQQRRLCRRAIGYNREEEAQE